MSIPISTPVCEHCSGTGFVDCDECGEEIAFCSCNEKYHVHDIEDPDARICSSYSRYQASKINNTILLFSCTNCENGKCGHNLQTIYDECITHYGVHCIKCEIEMFRINTILDLIITYKMLQCVNDEQLLCSSQIDNLIKQENILTKSINDTEESINTMRNAIFEMEPDTNSITDFTFFYNRIYEMEKDVSFIVKERDKLEKMSLSRAHYVNYSKNIDNLNSLLGL
jgi:hypothetical protein